MLRWRRARQIMKQPILYPAAKASPRHRRAIMGDNATAAMIVLADPAVWGGEDAGLVQWARLWIARNLLDMRRDGCQVPQDRSKGAR